MKDIITKALIIMAGKGTRGLPATKAIAKELFPIGNKPALLFLLKECLDSGIKEVILVISKQKKNVIKFLRHDKHLEELLKGTRQECLLDEWRNIVDNLKIKFVYQGRMNGGGGAVMSAKRYLKDNPFLLIIADDIFMQDKGQKNASQEVIDCFYKTGKYVVGTIDVSDDRISNYGIIKPGKKVDKNIFEVCGFVEKPKLGENPSNMASLARYVLLPNIFKNIRKCPKHNNGEVFFPEAIEMECEKHNVVSCKLHSKYYDLGNNLEYVKCVIETSLEDEKMGENFENYLKKLMQNMK